MSYRSVLAGLLCAGALMAQVPEIAFDAVPDLLKLPERTYFGEVAGVATNSKGRVYVYTRTGATQATVGGSRIFTHGGSRLFEFDRNGKYLREIGVGLYGFLEAQALRVDAGDNIWVVDKLSSMVIEFDQEGRVAMTLGRKPESVNDIGGTGRGGGEGRAGGEGRGGGRGAGRGGAPGAGVPGDNFNKPSDVAFDSSGNIFVADGYGNARVAKFNAGGKFLKSWGSRGSQQGQFDTAASIATDAKGNVYVADRGNKRIQVFDNEGAFQREVTGAGSPMAICISPGAHQYLYSSNSNDPANLDGGEIYRMELDGKILGKFGTAGKAAKEFGTVNAIDCRNPDELFVGELLNWRVQKLTLHTK
jgi:DNA-binding beta-propeller fold protein YncE